MTNHDALNWSSLASIGSSPVSKLTILMPFIGYLILLQDKVVAAFVPLALSGASLQGGLSVGFYLLYFGLFVFGAASFLFHIACPTVIKRFSVSDEYVERIQPLVTASDLLPKLALIIADAGEKSDITREATLYKSSISVGAAIQVSEAVRSFTLREYFKLLDRSRRAIRVVIFVLYVLGIGMTTVPSLIALARVSEDFVATYL